MSPTQFAREAAHPADRLASCPRCGGTFACGAARPATAPCPCAGIGLTPRQRAGIAARWQGCLCMACLRSMAQAPVTRAPQG